MSKMVSSTRLAPRAVEKSTPLIATQAVLLALRLRKEPLSNFQLYQSSCGEELVMKHADWLKNSVVKDSAWTKLTEGVTLATKAAVIRPAIIRLLEMGQNQSWCCHFPRPNSKFARWISASSRLEPLARGLTMLASHKTRS